MYEALVLLATVEGCALALGIAVFGFWLRRRLDAGQRRDQRAWAGLRKIARRLGVRLIDYEQSVFEENGLNAEERRELARTEPVPFDAQATVAGEAAVELERRRMIAPTPPSLDPVTIDPKDPDDDGGPAAA